jgi:hypothetical protein
VWKDFIANSSTLLPFALGLFGNQTTDVQSVVAKIKDFYNLTDIPNWPTSMDKLTSVRMQ